MLGDEKEDKVAELLGGLQRVDAPAGFEDRVMSRIKGSPTGERSRGPTFRLGLKFAAPAAALLLIGLIFVLLGGREPDITLVPPVQDGPVSPPRSEEIPSNTETAAVGSPSSDEASRTPKTNRSRISNGTARPRSSVSSEDMAVQGPGETFTPPGLDSRPRGIDPTNVSPGGGVGVRDVLSFIGIAADCGQDGCRVTSLSNGSLADRAKLNVGDRIVSIDGRPINGSTAFAGPTSFKSFQVVRGGRTIALSLTSN